MGAPLRIRYRTAGGDHELLVRGDKPALRARRAGDLARSALLRGLVRLDVEPGAGAEAAGLSGLGAPALRARLPYVAARDVARGLRGGTPLQFARRAHALRAHAALPWATVAADLTRGLRALGADAGAVLATPWAGLDGAAALAADVALALALRPRALLLDGPAHDHAAEQAIIALARAQAVPLVWDGCAKRTARAHTEFPPAAAAGPPASCPKRAGRKPPPPVPASACSPLGACARALAALLLSGLLLRADALAPGSRAREALAAGVRALAPRAGAVDIPWWRIATLLLILGGVAGVSARLGLGIGPRLGVAAVRCFVQLGCLGLVLVPIIAGNRPGVVLCYLAFMLLVAGTEAAGRPPYVYPRLFAVCCASLTGSVIAIASFVFPVVLGTGLDAQYIIPVLGMVMGSSLSAISVAVSTTVTSVAERKDGIEALLALGATRWEATREVVKTAVTLGLTPVLNMMSVTGLVSIPGMMTGQIIGGTSPGLAARYQLVIMYVVAGCSCASTVSSTLLTVLCLTDVEHRVRNERLSPRKDQPRMISRAVESLRAALSAVRRTPRDVEANGLELGSLRSEENAERSQYGTMSN